MVVDVGKGPASDCDVLNGVSKLKVGELGSEDVMVTSMVENANEGPTGSEIGSKGLEAPASVAKVLSVPVFNRNLALDPSLKTTVPSSSK